MIYLHHYPASLFSEKIRILLGHFNLEWQSVEISSIMPRPLLMPLSGGYRRTPVLQIGANVYSDTKIICKALARHVEDDVLYAAGFSGHRVADWADSQLFRIVVALNFRPEALVVMMRQFSEDEAAAFAKDRAELSGDAPIATLTPDAALAYIAHALAELEDTLHSTGEYLFGAKPTIADFSVYHNLWFLKNNPVNASILKPYAAVVDWMSKMAGIGHGKVVTASGEDALSAAKQASPQAFELQGSHSFTIAVGEDVAVAPVDYGCIPVPGKLVAQSHDEVIISRSTDETGEIFNHFPQAGFVVTQ